jgi:hypothetical protein
MTFINGNLSDHVCMTQPKGFINQQNARKVCRHRKSIYIYGLKQASCFWNLHFDEVVKSYDFPKNEEGSCDYKKASGCTLIFMNLYVDEILLIRNGIPLMENVKISLRKSFSMKNLGDASYILGMKIYRDRSQSLIGVSQTLYTDKMFNRFNVNESKNGFISMSYGVTLSKM